MVNELACLNCGKGFIPTCHITRQKFCSSECRVRYNNAKRYYTDTPVNECPECGTPIKQSGEAGSCTIIRNGRKSSRRIINRPFRSARIAEKTFSRNGVPAHSAASAATLAVSSGGQITGKQIHPWRKSRCGANAAGRRCARIRKSIAAVLAISEPWKKHTVSRYARGAEKNFQSMQGKNASIAAGTVPVPHRLRQRIFAEASEGFSIQNRKAGQSISSRQREKQSWIVTASASGLYAERPACTQGLTA